MTKTSLSFGLIKVEITDEKTSAIDLTNLAYNTLTVLIPAAEKLMRQQQIGDEDADCDDCEESDNCPNNINKVDDLQVKGLYQ
jgi:hypothetical protein